MTNYPVTPEENYNAICEEMKQLANELEQNPNMSEDRFNSILKRYKNLSGMLENYGQMMWRK